MRRTRLTEILIVSLFALFGALLMVRQVVRPTYTDSFYHHNAAVRLASSAGLTDTYLWTYIGQPENATLPTPSHLYWMPLTSLVAGMSMRLFNAPGEYTVAQLPLILLFTGTILIGYALGYRLGGTCRHAIIAAALTLFSGFFAKFWGEMDTFAAYACIGSLGLLAISYGLETRRFGWWALAGILAGLGHLTRSDGLLLLLTGITVMILLRQPRGLLIFVVGYLLVMLPWFSHLTQITGSPLPVGGLQGAWFTEYNDLFRYPPDASASEFFAEGLSLFISTRWTAFIQNLQTLLFVEGYIVLMPLMLIGLWQKRGKFTLPFVIFALGLHAAMTLVFAYPGWRGGLLHGAAALIPWWAAFAVVGLDSAVDWIAKHRRRWQPQTAKVIFSGGMVLLAVMLSLSILRGIPRSTSTPGLYAALQSELPADARLLINDPAQLYYYTGLGGAVLPNEAPDIIPQLAEGFGITHLVLENVRENDAGQMVSQAIPAPLQPVLTSPPDFLREIPLNVPGVRVYEIVTP